MSEVDLESNKVTWEGGTERRQSMDLARRPDMDLERRPDMDLERLHKADHDAPL